MKPMGSCEHLAAGDPCPCHPPMMNDTMVKPNMDKTLPACIYGWAYRLLQNHHDAQDATQDVLLRWHTKRPDEVENRKAWLRRMTINHCIDLMRKRRSVSSEERNAVEVATPLAEAANRELHCAVVAGLNRLTEQQRTVLVAKVYDRETFAAIAGSMGLSVSSVKTHYVRALRALREPLKHYTENES